MKLNIEIETDAELEKKYSAKITEIMQECIDSLSQKCFMQREEVGTFLRAIADAIESDLVLSSEEVSDLFADAYSKKNTGDLELTDRDKEEQKWEQEADEWENERNAEEEFRKELLEFSIESEARMLSQKYCEDSEKSKLIGDELKSFEFMIRQIATSAQFLSELRRFAGEKDRRISCGFLSEYVGRLPHRKPFSEDGHWVDLPRLQKWQFENYCSTFLWENAPEFIDRMIRLAFGSAEANELSHPLEVLKLTIRGNINVLDVAAKRTEWFVAAELAEDVQLPPKHVHNILRSYEDVKIVEIDRKKKPQKFLVNGPELLKMRSLISNIQSIAIEYFA